VFGELFKRLFFDKNIIVEKELSGPSMPDWIESLQGYVICCVWVTNRKLI